MANIEQAVEKQYTRGGLVEPTIELEESQAVVLLNRNILAECGISLESESHVLDFGCGNGRHVYEYLDAGYHNAFGYDLQNWVNLRDPSDRERFCFDHGADMSAIPFPDNHFDFVFSYSVFEHVLQQKLAFSEIFRVLKPGGVSLHNFPSKWRPFEPHICVPFGGAFQSYGYYLLWAVLGFRNPYQKGLSAREVARRNHRYGREGLNYLSDGELESMLSTIFDEYTFEEMAFLKHSKGRSRYLYRPAVAFPPLARLVRFAHTRVVLLKKAA